MSTPLQMSGVVKKFRQGTKTIHALNEVDLQVQSGEFIAVMGASGSGKSTMLHSMAGLVEIDGGKIFVDGQDLSTLSDAALTKFRRVNIGLVFQAFNLIPLLSAKDNVRLPGMGLPDIDQRASVLLERLGMQDRLTHKPDALSGGEQQRVAIARALVMDPAIMLVDEPTGSLDSVAGEKICRLLRELCDEQQRTIVVVTHEPCVALVADRVVVLKDGKIVDGFGTEDCKNVQSLSNRYQEAIRSTVSQQ